MTARTSPARSSTDPASKDRSSKDRSSKDRSSKDRSSKDNGAALLLAIGFVVMISSIGAALAALVTSGINNRNTLEQVRDQQYAAEGAIELAITELRSSLDATSSTACDTPLTSSAAVSLNSFEIRVDRDNACSVVRSGDGKVLVQRNTIFTACIERGATCAESDVIVRAQINFEQASTGTVTKTYVQSWNVAA